MQDENDVSMFGSLPGLRLYLFDFEECPGSGVLAELQKYFHCTVRNEPFLQRPLVTALVDEEELPSNNVRTALLNNAFVRDRCLVGVWTL
jgi:hypothetical protein